MRAVEEGKVSVNTALAIVKAHSKEQQAEAVKQAIENTPVKEQLVEEDGPVKPVGKGVALANEAINCLIKIPKNDALRKRGFQIVMDWIKANK